MSGKKQRESERDRLNGLDGEKKSNKNHEIFFMLNEIRQYIIMEYGIQKNPIFFTTAHVNGF